MKIVYSNYVGSNYKEKIIETPDGWKKVFISKMKNSNVELQDIILYDSNERGNLSRIYLELANADTVESIIEFCNKYGSIVSPLSSKASYSKFHDFGVLKNFWKWTTGYGMKYKNGFPYDYIFDDLFRYYQYQMKCLVEIYRFLPKNPEESIDVENLYFILQQCIRIISNPHFLDMLNIENNINIYEVEDYDELLAPFPFVNYIFRLHIKSENISDNMYYKEILQKIYEDNYDIHGFPYGKVLKEFLCKASEFYLRENMGIKSTKFESFLKNEKRTLFKMAECVFNDALSFEIRETRNIVNYHLGDYSDSLCKWEFSTLANALFFSFYFDKFDATVIKQCQNKYCRKLFACPVSKVAVKIYCSHKCAHNQANRKYKQKKSQELNDRKEI